MTLPGGWGSWNIIGWMILVAAAVIVAFFIGSILVGVCRADILGSCKRGWAQGVASARARREGREAP